MSNEKDTTGILLLMFMSLALGLVVGFPLGKHYGKSEAFQGAVDSGIAEWTVDNSGKVALHWKDTGKVGK